MPREAIATPLPGSRFTRHRDLLASGLRVVTVELPHLHTVSLVMYARVGSRYETPADNGLSHFLEHMLFRGTDRHPDAYRLNHAIEGLGGTLYAETGRDYSLYQLSLPPESVEEGVAIFGDIFRTPTFEGIDIERRIILEEILEDLDEDSNEVNLNDLARATMFPDHPLGYKITGPLANVERFTVDDVWRHFRRCYGARNTVLALSGAVERSQARPWVERAFAGMTPGRELSFDTPSEERPGPRFRYVESHGSQTSLQVLFRAFPEGDPGYPALQVLGRVLDDGMSTRLHRRVCDELGLAYYVSGSLEPFADAALWELDANCAHENVLPLLRESLALVTRLRDEPPTADEVAKAKRRYRWDLEASLDDPDAMAGWWGGTELFFPPVTFEEKLRRVEAVTPGQVSEVAARLFRPDRMAVAAVGMLGKWESKVRKAIEDFR